MALNFYDSEAKVLKLSVKKFLGLIPTLGEVTGEKLIGGGGGGVLFATILNRVNWLCKQ